MFNSTPGRQNFPRSPFEKSYSLFITLDDNVKLMFHAGSLAAILTRSGPQVPQRPKLSA